jgi:hypothetical protein
LSTYMLPSSVKNTMPSNAEIYTRLSQDSNI